jgi:hypothetical protein
MHFSLAEKCLHPQFVNFGYLAAFGWFLCFPSPDSGSACFCTVAACFRGRGLYPLSPLGLEIVQPTKKQFATEITEEKQWL